MPVKTLENTKKANNTLIAFRLPSSLTEQIDNLPGSRSSIIRLALETYLANKSS